MTKEQIKQWIKEIGESVGFYHMQLEFARINLQTAQRLCLHPDKCLPRGGIYKCYDCGKEWGTGE